LIAGGGAGGPSAGGGGGGAGGHIYLTGQTITAGSYNIVIGAGGDNDIGGNSTFSGYTALGGGNARAYTNDPSGIGTDGGCGGGGAGSVEYLWSGGTGSQGYNGGSGCLSSGGKPLGGGGGGGGQAGQDGLEDVYAGSGGTGFSCSIYSGTPIYYCGGGGGSVWEPQWNHIEGIGGPGGGGTGSWSGGTQTNAQANTGGGGGGGGGKGGSGVFIVRYLTSIFNTSSSGGTKHTYGNYTVHTFTENGTLVLNNP